MLHRLPAESRWRLDSSADGVALVTALASVRSDSSRRGPAPLTRRGARPSSPGAPGDPDALDHVFASLFSGPPLVVRVSESDSAHKKVRDDAQKALPSLARRSARARSSRSGAAP
jgi:hypothetical protein